MVYICFLVAVLVIAASPSPAAEPAPVAGKAVPAAAKTLVVRVDARTGRLVRSVSAPKPPRQEITDLVDKTAKALAVKWDDEIVKATALTRDGAVVHPNFQPKPAQSGAA